MAAFKAAPRHTPTPVLQALSPRLDLVCKLPDTLGNPGRHEQSLWTSGQESRIRHTRTPSARSQVAQVMVGVGPGLRCDRCVSSSVLKGKLDSTEEGGLPGGKGLFDEMAEQTQGPMVCSWALVLGSGSVTTWTHSQSLALRLRVLSVWVQSTEVLP